MHIASYADNFERLVNWNRELLRIGLRTIDKKTGRSPLVDDINNLSMMIKDASDQLAYAIPTFNMDNIEEIKIMMDEIREKAKRLVH